MHDIGFRHFHAQMSEAKQNQEPCRQSDGLPFDVIALHCKLSSFVRACPTTKEEQPKETTTLLPLFFLPFPILFWLAVYSTPSFTITVTMAAFTATPTPHT